MLTAEIILPVLHMAAQFHQRRTALGVWAQPKLFLVAGATT